MCVGLCHGVFPTFASGFALRRLRLSLSWFECCQRQLASRRDAGQSPTRSVGEGRGVTGGENAARCSQPSAPSPAAGLLRLLGPPQPASLPYFERVQSCKALPKHIKLYDPAAHDLPLNPLKFAHPPQKQSPFYRHSLAPPHSVLHLIPRYTPTEVVR